MDTLFINLKIIILKQYKAIKLAKAIVSTYYKIVKWEYNYF